MASGTGGWMKKLYFAAALLTIVFFLTVVNLEVRGKNEEVGQKNEAYREISGVVKRGETFFDIFKNYQLDISEMFELGEASADIHRLRDLRPGHTYKIFLDERDRINELTYLIDDENVLTITRTGSGFSAEKTVIV